jgi:PAS domain S-box-containing protein
VQSARLAAIVASSDDAIISKTLDGRITSWNAGASRIFGYEASEMIGEPITRIIPPELHEEETQILARLRRGEYIDHYETIRVAKDGRRVNISLTVSPLRDSSGKIIGASKIARDITERKQAEKLQRLLMEELKHRVKNTLAMVQSIAGQSLRHAKSPTDLVSSFSGRVQALARAHDLLTKAKLEGAEVIDIVREQILLGGGGDTRISYSGPALLLDAQTAVHLALVLHELATNARKYGALSVPSGRLSVTWEMRTNGGRNFVLQWKESGGPKVNAPKERGFGSTLIQKTLQSHGGAVAMCYAADGVSCQITVPLPEAASSNTAVHTAATQNNDTAPHLLQQLANQSQLQGKRIIIIEDEPLVALDVESSLIAGGCELIGSAGTVDTARALVAGAECDAALLDVNLAGHPVDELAAALTQRNIPFAFVTGYGREALPRRFRDALILKKPFSQEQLLAVLEALLYPAPGVVPFRQRRKPV